MRYSGFHFLTKLIRSKYWVGSERVWCKQTGAKRRVTWLKNEDVLGKNVKTFESIWKEKTVLEMGTKLKQIKRRKKQKTTFCQAKCTGRKKQKSTFCEQVPRGGALDATTSSSVMTMIDERRFVTHYTVKSRCSAPAFNLIPQLEYTNFGL